MEPPSIGEAGLRHPTGCTNELSQTKNTKMSESDISNSELRKSSKIIKKKSSSKLKKSKETIPDINILKTSRTDTRSTAKVKLHPKLSSIESSRTSNFP